MKQHTESVDVRIKEFLKRKSMEFPELRKNNDSSYKESNKDFFLENMITQLSR